MACSGAVWRAMVFVVNSPIVVGVDPGARSTGVVVVSAGEVIHCVLLENKGALLPVPAGYVAGVVGEVTGLVARFPGCVVAVEGVNRPSWHVAKSAKRGAASNPTGVIGTAVVLGAVMGACPDCVVVPPGRNGSRPLGAYPDCLVGVGEKRREGWRSRVGTGAKRHVRSAFDIAVAGLRLQKGFVK